jgi:hypothetical protein
MQVLLEYTQFILLIYGVAAGETQCFSDLQTVVNFTKFTKMNIYVNCVISKVAKKHVHRLPNPRSKSFEVPYNSDASLFENSEVPDVGM